MEIQELVTLYPPFLQEFAEIRELSHLITPELKRVNEELKRVRNDRFNNSMSLQAIGHWEQILGISPLSTDSLADRRFRILTRRSDRLPYTKKWLRSQMDSLLGINGYIFDLNPTEQTLHVKINVENKSRFETMRDFLERVVPLDIIITLEQLYNTHDDIKRAGMTHRQLSQFTHRQIRTDPNIL